jgi:hypothetical protein
MGECLLRPFLGEIETAQVILRFGIFGFCLDDTFEGGYTILILFVLQESLTLERHAAGDPQHQAQEQQPSFYVHIYFPFQNKSVLLSRFYTVQDKQQRLESQSH